MPGYIPSPELKKSYEVVIIGGGIAGALCAWKLASLGHRDILMLEAGDNGITQGQRLQFHHTMDTQGHRGTMYAPYQDLESRQWAPEPIKATEAFTDPYYHYSADRPKGSEPFKAGYNRMLGGSTWSWRGNCPRFLANDFRLRSRYGVGRDWPFPYEELEPWYVQAETELGVSGHYDEFDGLHGTFRSGPFPMPGIATSYSDQVVARALKGAVVDGTRPRPVTTPQARNSTAFDGRPACEGHSNCIPLCPIQAKYDATIHLRRALRLGVAIKTGAVVAKIKAGSGKRVTTVHYHDWRSRDPLEAQQVEAEHVVLAAHAIETPKLLLMSGLANSSDMVGRNLNDHAQYEIIALHKEPVYPFRGPQSITSIEDFRDGDFRSRRSAFRMTIGNDGWGRAGSPASVIHQLLSAGTWGSALPAAIADLVPRMIRISYSTETLPAPNNRVTLAPEKDAKLGLPRPSIVHNIGDYTRDGLRAGDATARALLKHMGVAAMGKDANRDYKELIADDGSVRWNTAAHIMSTTIMGDDPKDAVVDRWGRTHDHSNLWIVGSSVFPTGGTSNPTLTLAALTLRTAAAMHRQLAA